MSKPYTIPAEGQFLLPESNGCSSARPPESRVSNMERSACRVKVVLSHHLGKLVIAAITLVIVFSMRSELAVEQTVLYTIPLRYPAPQGRYVDPDYTGQITPIIIYNRVGKCGSRSLLYTVTQYVHRLRGQHIYNISYISSPLNGQTAIWDNRQRMELVEMIQATDIHATTFFSRHVNYLNFSLPRDPRIQASLIHPAQFQREIIYINMIRHPVDRFVSHFYFRQFGDSGGGRGSANQGKEPALSIDRCFQDAVHGKCPDDMDFRGYFYIIPFFCGHEKMCIGKTLSDRRSALRLAMYNVENNYRVVGLTEEFEATLALLEIELPGIFWNSSAIWEDGQAHQRAKTRTKNKRKPASFTRTLMAFYMPEEMEFYRFVRQLFEAKIIKHDLQHLLHNPIGYLEADPVAHNLAAPHQGSEFFNPDDGDQVANLQTRTKTRSQDGPAQIDPADSVKESSLKIDAFTETAQTASSSESATVSDDGS